jgi:hypothetical protein
VLVAAGRDRHARIVGHFRNHPLPLTRKATRRKIIRYTLRDLRYLVGVLAGHLVRKNHHAR